MKRSVLILFLLATPFLGKATHIVGGEFELIHKTGFQYQLNMILYFDEVNGSQGAKDAVVTVRIYRISDNALVRSVNLPYIQRLDTVKYTQPQCADARLITSKMLYTSLITLEAATFNHPDGYYIAWERCCRNYQISNVYSDDPDRPGPGPLRYAGQTFYLEFPPVVKNGEPFVDSTPRLFPPLSDYGSPGRPYYKDFGGVDDDNDSLVYSLVEPLSTHTSAAPTPIGPRPYPTVTYRPPYSFQHPMMGTPDLRISKDGLLTVTPANIGLFVFAVRVEEYRDHVKIGETRRDFQMFVVDVPKAFPPVILGKQRLSDPSYTFSETMPVFLTAAETGGDRCISVKITDPDSNNGQSEKITIKAVPLNFKGDVSGILPPVVTATLVNGSSQEFQICFPVCPFFNGIMQIGIIAMDDACALPLHDTLKVNLQIEPPPNHRPRITSPTPVVVSVNEGPPEPGDPPRVWPFQVVDDDGDEMDVFPVTSGFTLESAGMTFTQGVQTGSTINGMLKWDPYCDIYDFTKRTNFIVNVLVEDRDQCGFKDPAKALYNMTVILEPNADPIIDTDLTPSESERRVGLSRRIFQSLNFKVTGKDAVDNDVLTLKGAGKNFNYTDYGIILSPPQATENGLVTSNVSWDLKCVNANLLKSDSVTLQFIVTDDKNKCRFHKADTVDVSVKVLPPINTRPLLSVTNANPVATVLYNNSISMILGPSIDLLLSGTDVDAVPEKDNLKIELLREDGTVVPTGYTFEPVTGKSPAQTRFKWQPDCSIFANDVYENEYTFLFRVSDDHCVTALADSVEVKITIKDVDGTDGKFVPPNFFSPNGDNVNDYFAMEAKDMTTGEIKNILPSDNCASHFESVRIYNRWGNLVFENFDRNFKWYGIGESPGVYFYYIKYSRKEYKGSLSLRN